MPQSMPVSNSTHTSSKLNDIPLCHIPTVSLVRLPGEHSSGPQFFFVNQPLEGGSRFPGSYAVTLEAPAGSGSTQHHGDFPMRNIDRKPFTLRKYPRNFIKRSDKGKGKSSWLLLLNFQEHIHVGYSLLTHVYYLQWGQSIVFVPSAPGLGTVPCTAWPGEWVIIIWDCSTDRPSPLLCFALRTKLSALCIIWGQLKRHPKNLMDGPTWATNWRRSCLASNDGKLCSESVKFNEHQFYTDRYTDRSYYDTNHRCLTQQW
jgi:hypothetical protein